jgi:DNA transformation protein
MSVSQHYLALTIERLARVVPVSYRRIFMGYGVYHRGVQFAIIVNDHLYFRADELSRQLYQNNNMPPFQPGAVERAESSFYQLPDTVLENPAELIYWMRTAFEAAQHGFDIEQDEPFVDAPIRHINRS